MEPTSCTLALVWSRPGVEPRGFDGGGRVPVHDWMTIGRAPLCDVHIPAIIGGRRSYTLAWWESGWVLRHGGHVGRVRHNDGPPRGSDVSLRPGDTITFLDCTPAEAPVATVRLELA